jgi:hypothetical protein
VSATQITWAPEVADVAALIRARTKVRGGEELGTFTDTTIPTAEEVENLIDKAVRRVASKIGVAPCNEDLEADAKDSAALYAAMLVEQSYYPEQTRPDQSAFKSMQSLFNDAIKDLADAVRATCAGSDEGGPGVGVVPKDSFPAGDLVGWRTAW